MKYTPEELKADYDWQQAFMIAAYPEKGLPEDKVSTRGCHIADVVEVLGTRDGENEGDRWLGAFKLNDGRFLYVEAGCDYTGWDCRASGTKRVASSLKLLKRWCIPENEHEFLFPKKA